MAKGVGKRLSEVGGHGIARSAAVMGGDGIDDPLVLSTTVRLTTVEARKDRAGDENVRPESVVQRVEPHVVGGPNDGGVQLGVGRDLLEVRLKVIDLAGASRRARLESLREFLHVGDLATARTAGRHLRSLWLEHQADLVELLDVADRDRGHDSPTSGRHRDQPLGGHLIHRVANRCDAHAQCCRDHRGRDPLAWFELATKDPAEQPVVDLLLERSQLEVAVVVGAHVEECSGLMHQTSCFMP